MRLLFLDYETYFDDEYSLKKMTPAQYILDERFEVILCAVKEDNNPAQVIDGPDLGAFLTQFDPDDTVTVTHNALFDSCILAWHYGFVPKQMLDTLGMSRALLGHELSSHSLKSVAAHLGLGDKGDFLTQMKGVNRATLKMSSPHWESFGNYAKKDVELCAGIFFKLAKSFPSSERRLMDLVLRCAVQPRLLLDTNLIQEHIKNIEAQKAKLLANAGSDIPSLMSAAKFKKALEDLGVAVKMKVSPTGKTIPAIARTDKFMDELQSYPDSRVQALAAARLGHKSTLEETRSRKLLEIASLPWDRYRDGTPRLYSGGTMPVPLRYGGAHTHRLSGDWGMNMQNLPSSRKEGTQLRNALRAPDGYKVITCDLGQIEARLTAWICGAHGLLQQFKDKQDPYAKMASAIFEFEVNRKLHIAEGFIGKTAILGLGYGCGANRFYDMVLAMARILGVDIHDKFTRDIAEKAVKTYRTIHAPIPLTWQKLEAVIGILASGFLSESCNFGPTTAHQGYIELPSLLRLTYNDLQHVPNQGWHYRYGKFTNKLYGAKLLENIVQALARIVVMNAALRISDRGYKFVLQAHDELVYVVQHIKLDEAQSIIHTEMTRAPSWARDLPLTADVGVGQTYGEAK